MSCTTPKIRLAEYAGEYELRLTFDDGKSGIIDLNDQLWRDVFEPLRDISQTHRRPLLIGVAVSSAFVLSYRAVPLDKSAVFRCAVKRAAAGFRDDPVILANRHSSRQRYKGS